MEFGIYLDSLLNWIWIVFLGQADWLMVKFYTSLLFMALIQLQNRDLDKKNLNFNL